MKKDQFLFLDVLGQIDDAFIEASSQPWKEEKAATGENRNGGSTPGLLTCKAPLAYCGSHDTSGSYVYGGSRQRRYPGRSPAASAPIFN